MYTVENGARTGSPPRARGRQAAERRIARLAEPICTSNLLDFAPSTSPLRHSLLGSQTLSSPAMPSVKELRAAAAALGLQTAGMEKHELEAAVAAAEAAEEEKLLAEALAMSEESAETLAALSIAELRRRCEARGIETRGLAEKADLVAALLGTAMADDAAAPVAAATSPAAAASTSTIGRFVRPFVLYEARTASRADALDETGKVVLPAQQLTALAMATGGELPPTLLLRISHAEASVHVGVAEFADDAPLAAALPPEARRHWPFVVVVPRWVDWPAVRRRRRGEPDDCSAACRHLAPPPAARGRLCRRRRRRRRSARPPHGAHESFRRRLARRRALAARRRPPLRRRCAGGARVGKQNVRPTAAAARRVRRGAALAAAAADGADAPVAAACIVDCDVTVTFAPSLSAEAAERAATERAAAEAAAERAAAAAAAEAAAEAAAAGARRRAAAATALAVVRQRAVDDGAPAVDVAVRCADGARG